MNIKDIAKESGYSITTVSRALNNKPEVNESVRKHILEIAEKNGFQLNSNAKHLKQQTGYGVAIIVKGTKNMLFSAIIEMMQAQLKYYGYPGMVYYNDEYENEVDAAARICRERKPVAIAFLGGNMQNFDSEFEKIAIPCVLVTNSGEHIKADNLSSVTTDDAEAAYFAISCLIENGHRRIGVIGGNIDISYTSKLRAEGCDRAFREKGVEFDFSKHYRTCRYSFSESYKAMAELLKTTPDLTAVFCMSDIMAVGAIRAITDLGKKVPDDISVIGFDGIELASYLVPLLTTIKQNAEEISKRSVEILWGCISRGERAVHEKIPFEFIPGESVRDISK